jgi:outer membrane protein OmpA-like peptidoglycan-associated protein
VREPDRAASDPEPHSPSALGTAARTALPSEVEGGWVAPDHRRARREAALISIEQANRTPALFYEGAGARRVYVPTDPIFHDASAQLRPKADLVLARMAALLSLPSQPPVVLDVHTDSAGSHESQVALSEQRGGTIRGWLIQRGHVDPRRFAITASGGTRPLVPPDGNHGAQQPNRRIEIRLLQSPPATRPQP